MDLRRKLQRFNKSRNITKITTTVKYLRDNTNFKETRYTNKATSQEEKTTIRKRNQAKILVRP